MGVYIGCLEGRDMRLRPLAPSKTHAAASTAFEAALEGHGRSQQIEGSQEDDLLSQRPAKYRPHRPHRPQSADFQGFRAGGTKHSLPTARNPYRPLPQVPTAYRLSKISSVCRSFILYAIPAVGAVGTLTTFVGTSAVCR